MKNRFLWGSAYIPSGIESTGLYRDNLKRPDGMTPNLFSNGKSWVWDVTCPNAMAHPHIENTSVKA